MHALLKKKGWTGRWSGKEEVKYIRYLKENIELMKDKENRIKNQLFAKMAKQIKSRTSDQCRSHHHKLMEYYHSIENIILHYEHNVFTLSKNIQKLN